MSAEGIDYVRAGILGQTPVHGREWRHLVSRCNDATLREARARLHGISTVKVARIDQELRNRARVAAGKRPLGTGRKAA